MSLTPQDFLKAVIPALFPDTTNEDGTTNLTAIVAQKSYSPDMIVRLPGAGQNVTADKHLIAAGHFAPVVKAVSGALGITNNLLPLVAEIVAMADPKEASHVEQLVPVAQELLAGVMEKLNNAASNLQAQSAAEKSAAASAETTDTTPAAGPGGAPANTETEPTDSGLPSTTVAPIEPTAPAQEAPAETPVPTPTTAVHTEPESPATEPVLEAKAVD